MTKEIVPSPLSIGALVVCYGNLGYWLFDRFILGPLVLRPVDALLGLTTRAYAILLRASLAAWPRPGGASATARRGASSSPR